MKDNNKLQASNRSKAVANQVTQKKTAGKTLSSAAVQLQKDGVVQRAGEEEKDLQMKKAPVQMAEEEKDELQMKVDPVQRAEEEKDELQMKMDTVQREAVEDDELKQMKVDPIQCEEMEDEMKQMKVDPVQREEASATTSNASANNTGMPNSMKSNMENMSGRDLGDVKVNYNSEKPKSVGALAYAQGTDIHIGPGQEKHLGHEAWHVVQQKQGRVKATVQLKPGVAINDDPGLEKEADEMGAKATGR